MGAGEIPLSGLNHIRAVKPAGRLGPTGYIEPVSHSRDEPTDEPSSTDPTASHAPAGDDPEAPKSDTADTDPESDTPPHPSPDPSTTGPETGGSETGSPVEILNMGTVKSRPMLFVLLTCGFLVCLLCVLGTFGVIALLFLNG
ncbi:hypothetical protein FB566_1915 [Stackebrandtia endophytica]|uniref:Uncharacterized protein n=1 Tax=Stackebrandtia endophytica TaxID=1496996 RepID=A0A543AV09_9ACTN|nr:hypothetical protein FB566_1915 [Stackebrandtia endophytica]